ncbi:MAG: FAD-dependent oxidoreductase [Candidatus Omnitrophica bacterium]|nr:FAD-dependent oxidoreductase [Candidatus Omnitrophota bacterium]
MILPIQTDIGCGPPVTILGGGMAGLSAAYHMNEPYVLYEREKESGGLCRSEQVNGFVFDFDGHLLHFRTDYARDLVFDLTEGKLCHHRRRAWVYSHGTFSRYPFQANAYGLPDRIVADCLRGRELAAQAKPDLGKGYFLDWIYDTFGVGIAEHFMIPYNRKFWKVPLKDLNCEWVDRFIPVPSLQETFEGAYSDSDRSWGYNSEFWYPSHGGIADLTGRLAQRVGSIYCNHEVIGLDLANQRVRLCAGGRESEVSYENLVLTLPLPAVRDLLGDLPPEVDAAFDKLRYISVLSLSLGIARESLSDKHWIYYPEPDLIFHRVGFPGNFSPNVHPPGTSSLYAETTYLPEQGLDFEAVRSRILSDLAKVGILEDGDRILAEKAFNLRFGYIIYDSCRREAVECIRKYLRGRGVHCAGRFGRWEYMSMEDTLLDGARVAEEIGARRREVLSVAD